MDNDLNIAFGSLNSDSVWYSSYFAMAAISGVRRADALLTAISSINNLDIYTMEVVSNGYLSQNYLSTAINTAYQSIYLEGISLEPMRTSFVSLSNYIENTSKLNVDDYFTSQGIQVPRTYANLSSIYGYPISEENIQ